MPLLAGACDALGGGETIQLDDGEVRLSPGSDLHDVTVGGAGATDSLSPRVVDAEAGDAVRFTVNDHRTHALAFDTDALDPGARDFLERTYQLRGPPLVDEGAAWVVSFEDAPPGTYPFVCRSHGATGEVTVTGGNGS